MMSIPAGKACVITVDVMDVVSMGKRVSHPRVAAKGRRSGHRLRSRVSLCVVAACASGHIFDHAYCATAWPDFWNASSHVAIAQYSSTRSIGVLESMNSGMFARERGFVWIPGTILGVLGAP